jgi:hypothetical protein
LELSEKTNLERFRRVAKHNRVTIPEDTDLPAGVEIEFYQAGLNALLYSKAQDWMLPNWVLSAKRSAGSDSIVDSFPNNKHRNWAPIGGVGAKKYAIVDSSGLLRALPACGSLDVWLQGAEKIIFPALSEREDPHLQLFSPDDQIYEWSTSIGPIEYSRLIYHVSENEEEAIFNEIQLKNVSLEKVKFTFYVAIRPTSVLGVEPIESLEYDPTTSCVYSNGVLALMTDQQPVSVIFSTADNPNLLSSISGDHRTDKEFTASRGLAIAVLRFDITMGPATTNNIFFVNPLSEYTKGAELPQFTMSTSSRDANVESWFGFAGKRSVGAYPDHNVGYILAQAKAILGIQSRSAFLGESNGPHRLDSRESVRVLLALSRTGGLDFAERLSITLLENINKSETELTAASIAPLVWGVLQVFNHGRNMSFLKELKSHLDKLVESLSRIIEDSLAPPLVMEVPVVTEPEEFEPVSEPEELSEDEPSQTLEDTDLGEGLYPSDDEPIELEEVPLIEEPPEAEPTIDGVIESLWNLEAIRETSKAFEMLDDVDVAKSLQTLTEEYLPEVKNQIEKLGEIIDTPYLIELISGEEGVQEVLSLISTLAILRLSDFSSDIASCLLDVIEKELLFRSLFRHRDSERRISSHHALRIAQYYVLIKQRSQAEKLLNSAVKLASEYYILPEFVDPRTSGGSYGQGSSIMAATDMLLLIRDMGIIESGEDLIIFPGIPADWYTSNNPLIVSRIPTTMGTVHLELGTSANQHQIEVRTDPLPKQLEIHVPENFSLPMVKVYGGSVVGRVKETSSKFLNIVPLTNSVVLTFHR